MYLAKVLIWCSAFIVLLAALKALKIFFSRDSQKTLATELQRPIFPKYIIIFWFIYCALILVPLDPTMDFGVYNYKYVLGLLTFEIITHICLHKFNKIKINNKFLLYNSLFKLVYLAPVAWCSKTDLFYISTFAAIHYMLISIISFKRKPSIVRTLGVNKVLDS